MKDGTAMISSSYNGKSIVLSEFAQIFNRDDKRMVTDHYTEFW